MDKVGLGLLIVSLSGLAGGARAADAVPFFKADPKPVMYGGAPLFVPDPKPVMYGPVLPDPSAPECGIDDQPCLGQCSLQFADDVIAGGTSRRVHRCRHRAPSATSSSDIGRSRWGAPKAHNMEGVNTPSSSRCLTASGHGAPATLRPVTQQKATTASLMLAA